MKEESQRGSERSIIESAFYERMNGLALRIDLWRMGSIESVEKKEGQSYSLNRRNLNIEETVLSNRSAPEETTNQMKKRSARVLCEKMSDKGVLEKSESCDEALSKKDNDSEAIETCKEEDKNVLSESEANENDENGVSAEKNKAKKYKKSLSSGDSENEETNDDCPVDGSKKQGKDSKKGSQKKGNKKKKRGRGKKEKDDYKDNESDLEYEIEKILEVKLLRNGKKEFLIQWKGFSPEYNSWEPEVNLDCEDLIKEYFEENKKVLSKGSKEREDESENSSDRRRSKSSEYPKKSTGRKRRLSEDKTKETQEQSRPNRSRLSRRRDSIAEETESTERVTRSSRGKKTKDSTGRYKRKRGEEKEEEESESDDFPPRRSERGKARKGEKDQNKENFGKNEDESERGSGSEESRDSGVDAAEYEVEKIVDVRRLENGSREFLIKWKGFSSKDNSWEPEKHLNCDAKVKKFLQGVEQNSSARELRFERKTTDRFTLQSQRHQRKLSSRLEKLPRKSYKEVD